MIQTITDSISSLSASEIIGLSSLIVIGVSVVLQYISHRNSVIDNRFEREQKILTNLGEGQIEVEKFSENEYDISIKVKDADVREKTGWLYKIMKIGWPTGDLRGTTVVKMMVKPDHPIENGLYEIKGFNEEYGGLRGVFLSLEDAKDVITIEIDTVDAYEVPPTLTNNMSFSQNLQLLNKTENPEEIGYLIQEISTPTEQPYQ